jgi:tetratricopeptide (TPR) repeat protein
MRQKQFQKILIYLTVSLLMGCANSNHKTTLLFSNTKQAKVDNSALTTKLLPNKPQLNGIPLSCHSIYLQSTPIKEPKDDPLSEERSRRYELAEEIVDAYLDADWHEQALQVAEVEPGHLWIKVAQRLAEVGQIDRAIQIAQTIESKKSHGEVKENLVDLYITAKQPQPALKLIEAMMAEKELSYSEAKSLVKISALYAQEKQPIKAKQLVDRALRMIDSWSPEYKKSVLFITASRYAEMGQSQQALQFLKDIRQEDIKTGEILLKVARSYIRNQQIEQALEILNEVQQLNEKLLKRQWQLRHPPTLPHHTVFSQKLVSDTALASQYGTKSLKR